ncbi:MAG: hypothetical protein BGP04_23285 [Rhizobiales bacterium 62-17]|nr:hypothetical protein [Hyphomicrobiales bacterium]OJY00483.1 MAG: hypothetical protein BGP04_23285 [Rhizobiales bacterium 62-17]
MRIIPLISVVALAALLATASSAQMISPPMPVNPRALGTRVSVTIQITTPIPANTATDAQMLLIENARKRLYQSTAAECAILSEVYKSECRLVSVNANSSIQMRGGTVGDVVNATGSAVYELLAR